MFGTVFRMRAKPGEIEAIYSLMDRWAEQRAPKVQGVIASYLLRTAADELLGVAVFQDEETYRANASDPEQDKWYRQLRSHLVSDPEWNDGYIGGRTFRQPAPSGLRV